MKVERTYEDFLKLTEYYSSVISAKVLSPSYFHSETKISVKLIPMPILPDVKERKDILFDCYLNDFLIHIGDEIWNFPQILSFFDDTMDQTTIKDAHVLFLSRKVSYHYILTAFFFALSSIIYFYFYQYGSDLFISVTFMFCTAFIFITVDTIVVMSKYS